MYEDTIAAIATPLATGAISIIRVSGDDAIAIVNSLFDKDLTKKASHTITYGFIYDGQQPVDEVLVSIFRAPKTYTREDIVEINSHGGVHVTRKILELVLSAGARMARPGEFTQRAFISGRIDLSQAEAVEDMIEASSDQAISLAIAGIRGSIRKLLEPLIDELMNLIAAIEVNIDYPEYDDAEVMTADVLLPRSKELLKRIDEILHQSRTGQMVKEGVQTVIAGKPNVGKSSLLNALLEEDKAIVTDIAGTTRDVVEGVIRIGPLSINLVDTAGIRNARDTIEQIGIEKSRRKLEEANLILLVFDGSRPLDEQDKELLEKTEGKDRILIVNKKDVLDDSFCLDQPYITISASARDIQPLLDELEKRAMSGDLQQTAILSNERQIGLLKNAQSSMMKAVKAMEQNVEPDLIEIDLQLAHQHLKEILGEVHRDDLLDTLFTNFCLGK